MEWRGPRKAAGRPPKGKTLKGWVEFVRLDPADPVFRARLAALLLRAGLLDEAEEQLTACLELCPPTSRRRLQIVVLRERVRAAGKRRSLLAREGLIG